MSTSLNKSTSRMELADCSRFYTKEYSTSELATQSTKSSLKRAQLWGNSALFTKVLILRGVGYKFFKITNDQANKQAMENTVASTTSAAFVSTEDVNFWNSSTASEFPYSEFLVARVGHTKDLCWPIPKNLYVKAVKKDKKLVVYGSSKLQVTQFVSNLIAYRSPSVYTGRGVRIKHIKPIRKAGKRDQRKGKAF